MSGGERRGSWRGWGTVGSLLYLLNCAKTSKRRARWGHVCEMRLLLLGAKCGRTSDTQYSKEGLYE